MQIHFGNIDKISDDANFNVLHLAGYRKVLLMFSKSWKSGFNLSLSLLNIDSQLSFCLYALTLHFIVNNQMNEVPVSFVGDSHSRPSVTLHSTTFSKSRKSFLNWNDTKSRLKQYAWRHHKTILKLYCRYEYTKPCSINRIWGLKKLWLQVSGHAWFHLQRLRWPVRNEEGAKNSKWKYMSPAGFEPTSRQSTTGKSTP